MKNVSAFLSVAGLLAAGCVCSQTGLVAEEGAQKTGNDGGKAAGAIVFSSNRSGAWRIWTCNADGSEPRELVTGAGSEENDVDPTFSPDRKSVLFTSTRGGKPGVWRAAIDGAGTEKICEGDQAEHAPCGTKICFRKNDKIFVRDLKTGTEKQIVPDSFKICVVPSWSPDGKTIAFASRQEVKDHNSLFVVDAEGGEPKTVYDKKGACEPHWSPDGKTLVYETETHLCSILPDGQKNRLLTYWGGVQRYGRFSQDGSKIIFCQGVSEKGPWELYTIPATGGQPEKLTEGGSDMYPDWR